MREVFMLTGETELSIGNYKKSLKLNPNNSNAPKMLKEIKNK